VRPWCHPRYHGEVLRGPGFAASKTVGEPARALPEHSAVPDEGSSTNAERTFDLLARGCARVKLRPEIREPLAGRRDEAIPRRRATKAVAVISSERALDRIQGVNCPAKGGPPSFVALARIGQ
jgi:hypothetical protein